MTDCPKCGTSAPYACTRSRQNGSVRLDCRNPACRHNFNTLTGTARHKSKMAAETWDAIETLRRDGLNAHRVSKRLGIDYRSAWNAFKRLEAANV